MLNFCARSDAILSIPLCTRNIRDFWAWCGEKRGGFSVKSAYKAHVAMLKREANKQQGASSSYEERDSEMFKAIWKQKSPPTVHHFLWRFAHNSHPMYMNISRRGVKLDTRCAACGRLFEDGGHLFLNCKMVKYCWRALLLEDVRLQLLNSLLKKASDYTIVKVIVNTYIKSLLSIYLPF